MPPRRRVLRTQAASSSREGGDEHVQPPVPPINQDALRQMVQDAARHAAQEAVQQAVQEAASVSVQEVVRQMAAAQHGQQVSPVQVQGHQQPPIQPVPPVKVRGQQQPPIQQVPGVIQVPPPPPPVLQEQVPEVDETLIRVMRQMKSVHLETFGRIMDPIDAYNFVSAWGCIRIVGWSAIEASWSVRKYDREFCQLRLFAGNNFNAEDLIKRFLVGMRVDLCGRCSMVTYTSLADLVEKTAVQEACTAEEKKYSKAAQPKSGKTSEPQKRTWEQLGAPSCDNCLHHHFGECVHCFTCGRMGHVSKYCRSNKPMFRVLARLQLQQRDMVVALTVLLAAFFLGGKGQQLAVGSAETALHMFFLSLVLC
ncbi:hypothetical protein DY000_02030691 [Brassica cretica]|uniref:CCHC-type domain-containing protein n=1 Tax=Brassica cretica TaxID=69181 RepID=A0ABQ7DHK6_BRACR|nr:hypothetical protein DY000_02030691 [Brassica cretica]